MSADDISARAARLAEMIMPELEEKHGGGEPGPCWSEFVANKPLFYGSMALVGLAVVGGVAWAINEHNKRVNEAAAEARRRTQLSQRRQQQQKAAAAAARRC